MSASPEFAVIDDVVITGSASWSKAAWSSNHEVVLMLMPARRAEPAIAERSIEQHQRLWKRAGT